MTIKECERDPGARLPSVHTAILDLFLTRRAKDVAAMCSGTAIFRLVHRHEPLVFDEATGPEGIASIVARMHENVEFRRVTLSSRTAPPMQPEYDWTAVVRNWGFGGSLATNGSVRIAAENGVVTLIEIALEPEIFYGVVRPDLGAANGRRCLS